jgi:hypothetical protein
VRGLIRIIGSCDNGGWEIHKRQTFSWRTESKSESHRNSQWYNSEFKDKGLRTQGRGEKNWSKCQSIKPENKRSDVQGQKREKENSLFICLDQVSPTVTEGCPLT